MSKIVRHFLSLTALAIIVVSGVSCGGTAGNNDQGVSFTLLGFFAGVPSDPCGEEPGAVSGVEVGVSEADESNSGVSSVLGLQNNLSGQFIRTQRVFLKYFVPDSSLQPPNTNVPASRVIAPFVSADSEGSFDSSLPDSFGDEEISCNRAYVRANVITAEVRNFLNINRSSLPEFPYTLIVTATVSGVTSSGETHDTNEVELFVQVNSDLSISSSDGTGGDTGTDTGEETA